MGNNNWISYIALGDSLTLGVGALRGPGFVEQYAKLSQDALSRRIIYRSVAKNGAETKNLLNILQNPFVGNMVRNAEIITITSGGNDLRHSGKLYFKTGNLIYLTESLLSAKTNMYLIIKKIQYLKSKSNDPYFIRILNLYNPSYLIEVDQWIQDYNNYLLSLQSNNILVADIYSAFYGRYNKMLFLDKTHPSELGYQVMARQLYNLGYYPIIKNRSYDFI